MRPFSLPLPELCLRLAVAVAFVYPAISALFDPVSWFGYFPKAIQLLPIDPSLLLHGFGALEVLLALWILLGKRVFIPSVLATIVLMAIVVVHYVNFPILFRDVSIALAALALAFMHRNKPA